MAALINCSQHNDVMVIPCIVGALCDDDESTCYYRQMSVLSKRRVDPSDSGFYRCTASNVVGRRTSPSVHLIVKPGI